MPAARAGAAEDEQRGERAMISGTAVSFSRLDWAVVAAYFLTIGGIAIWAALQKEKDTEDYFLASRDAAWFLIGASIFASNIGAEHLVGLAGTGAGSGMAFAHWELHSYLCLVLGWVFAPFYIRSGVFTTPEFLERRYTPATRTVLSLIFMVSYILTKASVTIYAGAIAISTILGYQPGAAVDLPVLGATDFFWFAAFALVIVTGVYTVTGGMKAVLWTEGLQAPLLLIGSLVILVGGLRQVGGLEGLRAANPATIHLWRPLSTTPETQGFPGFLFDPSETPWLGVMLASPIIGLWYWCTDQYIVQRVLTARNIREARRGTLWAGYLKLFPVFIFLLPGMIAVALKQQGVDGFADMERPDEAFPRLVSHLLPEGLRGLVLAGMLAALMSSLASLFNSTATLFTVDFYRRLRPRVSEAHLVNVGRLATVAVVGAGMAWIPLLETLGNGSLYGYLQLVQSLLAPSIAAVFMLGIFSRRLSPISGLIGIASGFVLGMGRLALIAASDAGLDPGGPLGAFVELNWLYFSFLLFVFTCALMYAVSAVTPTASPEKLANLTIGTITLEQQALEGRGYGFWEIVHSIVILAVIAGVYAVFW
jgi:SSS family solute:Na+ symporter